MHNGIGLRITDESAAGHLDVQCLTVFAGAAFAGTVAAIARYIFSFITEIHQCGHVVIHLENDVAASAAISAVGAAGRHIFLAMECYCAVAAVSGTDEDLRFIYKRSCHERNPFAKDKGTGKYPVPFKF